MGIIKYNEVGTMSSPIVNTSKQTLKEKSMFQITVIESGFGYTCVYRQEILTAEQQPLVVLGILNDKIFGQWNS